MGIFDVLKPKWSSKYMSEDDRRKIFWYLKRASSYTAWKAQADAFDRFAAVFERQVNEQPVAVREGGNPEWATRWEPRYPEILKAQVHYEQGVARLREGDRTVWLYNERGALLDAKEILGYWYTALVNHGPHGDIYFRGKYVDELTAVIDEATTYVKATAGILQSPLAEPPAVHFWSPERMARLDREVPFPATLPDVPKPDKQITVRTGEPAPCFGIYEPLVEDGCMNYLLEGASTPQAVNRGAIIRPAVWRLIWEDRRYLDGTIPEEEKLYFKPRDTPAPAPAPAVSVDPVISLESGQRASRTGAWVVAHRLDIRRKFELGDTLPQHEGRDVVWLWVSKD